MVLRTKLHMGQEGMDPMEIYQIRYGMGIWLLQENAGLTYNEARAYMSDMRNETTEQLAEALGVKKQTVYDLRNSAREKLDGKLLDDVLMGYNPLTRETSRPIREPFF
ncbi:MAG: helix-turn-helix domain-containing protein [Methanomassiliicoccaceae archaeon]|nr:helix-turn-helix domain-containing protein [Methanomassiliicoccaceae archaeon]